MEQSLRILVVDDDEVLRKLIVSVLETVARVHSLSSGHEAIAYLSDNETDLIFSDVCMPEGSGIELLDWVHSHRENIPLVFVTGNSPITSEEAVRRGAKLVINKPFRMKALLDVVKKMRPAKS